MTRRTVVGCEELSFATSVAVAPDDDCAPRCHVRIAERLIHPKEDTYLSAVGGKRGRAGSPEIECTLAVDVAPRIRCHVVPQSSTEGGFAVRLGTELERRTRPPASSSSYRCTPRR